MFLLPHGEAEFLEPPLSAAHPLERAILQLQWFSHGFPGGLEALHAPVVEPRHDLHEGGEVVELHALGGKLDEEFEELAPIHRISLTGHAPHEEQRHL